MDSRAAGRKQPLKHELGSSGSTSSSSSGSSSSSIMLAMAQKCSRAAKNGREQQRAQRISDAIDELKVISTYYVHTTKYSGTDTVIMTSHRLF